MDWTEVTVKTTTGGDIVAQVFYDVGVTGVVVEDRAPFFMPKMKKKPGIISMNRS